VFVQSFKPSYFVGYCISFPNLIIKNEYTGIFSLVFNVKNTVLNYIHFYLRKWNANNQVKGCRMWTRHIYNI